MTVGFLLVGLIAVAAPPVSRYEPDREPKSPDDLYLAYRYYGLPLPPPGATLVRWAEYTFATEPDGVVARHADPAIGLVVRPLIGTKPAVVWEPWGERTEFAASRLRPVPPTAACLDGLHWNGWEWLTFAAWAHHLGWPAVARRAFDRGVEIVRLEGGSSTPVLQAVRARAWKNAYDGLTRPGTDRRQLRAKLRLVYDADPAGYGENAPDLFRSLDLTLRAPRPVPGRFEVLVDRLTECHRGPFLFFDPVEPPDAIDRLAEQGFDAVPALIAHLSDDRLTRSAESRGVNNFWWTYVRRVGDVCRAVLDKMSNHETSVNEGDPTPDVIRKKASAWFDGVQKVGEEKWAVAGATPDKDGVFNELALRVVRAKYPHRLPELYRAESAADSYYAARTYAAEVAASSLDRDTKLKLFREAAASRAPGHRLAAAIALERCDAAEFRRTLRTTLQWLSTARLPDRVWEADVKECNLLSLVARSGDPDDWTALAEAYGAAPVSLRMRLIDQVFDEYPTRAPDKMAGPVRFLTLMLSDRVVRDAAKERGFPHPGVGYPKLAVGDFAALKLAEYLDTEVGSSRVDLQACKLEYSIVSPK